MEYIEDACHTLSMGMKCSDVNSCSHNDIPCKDRMKPTCYDCYLFSLLQKVFIVSALNPFLVLTTKTTSFILSIDYRK
jgi:hypothetical protein